MKRFARWAPTAKKAWVAFAGAAAVALGVALEDGQVTGQEWGWIGASALVGVLTWFAKNAEVQSQAPKS